MIELNNKNNEKVDYPIITQDYCVLHFDERPILFAGKDNEKKMIVASALDENLENRIFRYIYAYIFIDDYGRFLDGLISYRELLKFSYSILITDLYEDRDVTETYNIKFDDLPDIYKPTEDSFLESFGIQDISETEFSNIIGIYGKENLYILKERISRSKSLLKLCTL